MWNFIFVMILELKSHFGHILSETKGSRSLGEQNGEWGIAYSSTIASGNI